MATKITTARNITESQIETLRVEAMQAADYDQAAICIVALDEVEEYADGALADELRALSRAGMTQAEAVAECARVINAAAQRTAADRIGTLVDGRTYDHATGLSTDPARAAQQRRFALARGKDHIRWDADAARWVIDCDCC